MKIKLLLVDDDPRNLDALEAILENPDYDLLRALDAGSALRLLLDNDVAAIILDIKMPGTSGFELAHLIKSTKRYRQIPILFLTAYPLEDQDVVAGYGAGAVDCMTKPLNPQIVRHKVAVFAELFRKTRALEELNTKLEERVLERTAELERSEAALRAADRQKDEFIAVLAHELRNPLAPLRWGLAILSKPRSQGSPGVATTLASMNRQLNHMVRLIDDLLDMSRVSRGAIELKREPANLKAVIQTAVEMNRSFIERHRHKLSLDIDRAVSTFGDPTRIVQIIGNLLHNAAKFTPEGGEIRVELATASGEASVRVIDSGEGIQRDQIEHAFQMFARLPRGDSQAERGLGIGLALGRRLAELHRGSLTAESHGLNCGTAFTLRLPLLHDVEVPAPIAAAGSPAAPVPSLNIVVIEDSEDVAEMLAVWLRELGHRVSIARSGLAGLELVAQERPQVVLCNLGLPQLDGAEVCRRVRKLALDPQPLMVALTGWGREADRGRTKEAGFDEHLVKPVATETLLEVLGNVAA